MTTDWDGEAPTDRAESETWRGRLALFLLPVAATCLLVGKLYAGTRLGLELWGAGKSLPVLGLGIALIAWLVPEEKRRPVYLALGVDGLLAVVGGLVYMLTKGP